MLNGDQKKRLRETIIEYYLPEDFETFLSDQLDQTWHLLVNANSAFPHQVRQVIEKSNFGRWYGDLVIALLKDKPDAKGFAFVAYAIGLENTGYTTTTAALDAGGLEAMVNSDPMLDVNLLVSGIVDNKKCICRIEIPGEAYTAFGTGFLVGPDLLLTNFHVVEALLNDQEGKLSAVCKFDFEVREDGSISVGGTSVEFVKADIIARSPYSSNDATGSVKIDDASWPSDQLDYALIRLSKPLGEEDITYLPSTVKNNIQKRGWIKVGSGSHEPYSGNFFILQHPKGRPMKVAIGLKRMLGLSVNKTRIRYGVNTMSGSSGSPCFDEKFNWIALHNMGDPEWNPAYNQGITTWAIINDLKTKGIEL